MSFKLTLDLAAHPELLRAAIDFISRVATHRETSDTDGIPTPPHTLALNEIPDNTHGQTEYSSEQEPDHVSINTAPNVELDVNGLPWDARIHARTKIKMADGAWKKRRGVDLKTVRKVEAELSSSDLHIGYSNPEQVGANMEQHQATIAPPAPPIAPVAAPPPPPAPPANAAFANLMQQVTTWVNSKLLTHEAVATAAKLYGLDHIGELHNRPDLVPGLSQHLRNMVGV